MRSLLALILCASAALAEPVEVAQLPAKIVPEQATTLMAEAGVLSDLADASQHQERGAVVAILNKERTEQEREEMELNLAKEALGIKDEIRKLQAQRSKVEFYLKLSDKEKAFAQNMLSGEEKPTRESLRDIDERLSLQRRALESGPRMKHNEFERNHAKLTLRMPFSGRLQFHATLPEDIQKPFEYTPTPGQPFATVCDDSAFYITISLSRADLTQLPPERLSTVISLPEGRKLTGTYDHSRVERATNGSGDMLVYFFKLPQEDHETAFRMLGSNAKARLLYDAGEGTRRVNKAEMVAHPEAAECADWEELVARLYPDCDIVVIGDRDIILRPRPTHE